MTLIEACWAILHACVLLGTAVAVGLHCGWVVGFLSGIGAMYVVMHSEVLIAYVMTAIWRRARCDDGIK